MSGRIAARDPELTRSLPRVAEGNEGGGASPGPYLGKKRRQPEPSHVRTWEQPGWATQQILEPGG